MNYLENKSYLSLSLAFGMVATILTVLIFFIL